MDKHINFLLIKDSVNLLKEKKGMPRDSDICKKTKCVKNIPKRLPPLRKVNQNDEEIWGVKALPSDWTPVSKPSKIITRIMMKREEEHMQTIETMKCNREIVNTRVEMQIRKEAEILKKSLEIAKNDGYKLLEVVNVKDEEVLTLENTIFNEILTKIDEIYAKVQLNINNYYKFLQDLEKERSEEYKIILKDTYKKLHVISFQLPYDLQKYFEHEILNINQIILANIRCYEDLHLQLTLQVQNDKRIICQEVADKRDTWKYKYKRSALEKLIKTKLNLNEPEKFVLSSTSGQTASSLFLSKEIDMEAIWEKSPKFPIRSEDVEAWSFLTQENVDALDSAAKNLVNLYKMAIVKVFHGYFEELNTLTEKMVDTGIATDDKEVQLMTSKVFQPMIQQMEKHYTIELSDLETLWTSVITQLQKKIQKTYVFLQSSAHLWDLHFGRLEQAQRIVLKDLAKTIEKNDKSAQAQEQRINVNLDVLRQESDLVKLESSMASLIGLMDALKSTYNSHYSAEVKVIEKYKKLVDNEINVLIAELQQFLETNPKETEMDPKMQRRRASQLSDSDPDPFENLIPKQMKMCEYQVDAVHNWMFGLWEAIEKYMLSCREEIQQQASTWVIDNIKKIAKRLEVKMALHMPRYDRMKYDIYDVRSAELQLHNDRLESHKAGIEKEMNIVKEQHEIFEKQYRQLMEDYEQLTELIMKRVNAARTVSAINQYINQLQKTTENYRKKFEKNKTAYEELCKEKVDEIKKAGINFSKEMRLFSEDGNFSHDESKKINRNLKKFEKIIKKKLKAITKEVNTKFKKLNIQFGARNIQVSEIIMSVKEEMEFKETSEQKIKNTQTSITRDVFDIKFSSNTMKCYIKDLMMDSRLHIGELEFLDDFISNCQSLVKKMMELANHLLLPYPMVYADPRDKIVRQASTTATIKTSIISKRKTSKKSKSSKLSSITTVTFNDYKLLLYKQKPENDESFMGKLCSYIYNSFDDIQNQAKDFYATYKPDSTRNKIPSTYDDFIEQILSKHQYYHLQCEMVWLDLVNDFIKMTDKLLNFMLQYGDDFLQKYFEDTCTTYKNSHETFLDQVKTIKKANNDAFRTIHDKLKPLHGHPKNANLLEDLNQQMKELTEAICDNVVSLIPPHRETQEEMLTNFEPVLIKMASKLKVLEDTSTVELLNVKLINQLDDRLQFLESMLSEEPLAEDEAITKIELGTSRRLSAYKKDMKIPEEYRVSLEHSKMLLERVLSNYSTNRYLENVISQPSSMDPADSVFIVIKILQDFSAMVQNYIEIVDEVEETAEDDNNKWKEMWNIDVERVLKLYTVKYDFPKEEDTT